MDRRTILAFFVIALILILMNPYYKWISKRQGIDTSAPPSQEQKIVDRTTVSTLEKEEAEPSVKDSILALSASLLAEEEQLFHVKTDLYSATISSRAGGTFTAFKLKEYNSHDGKHVNLIKHDVNDNNLLIRYQNLSGETVTLAHPFSLVEGYTPGDTIYVEPNDHTFTFESDILGHTISKSLTFHNDTYLIDISVDLSSISKEDISQERFTLNWDDGLPTTEKDLLSDTREFVGYIYQGGTRERIKHHKDETKTKSGTGQTSWASLRSKYFIAALIPIDESDFGQVTAHPYNQSNSSKLNSPKYGMSIGFPSNKPNNCSLYLGPLKYNVIKSLNVKLEKTMNFGISIIRPISKGVLYLLTAMHKVIPNYGVLLIIFAILVKIIVYPLTKKSYKSTKEMQAIQPLIMELKEKYKGDAQRLNKATMSLYKEHGVNPLGGCIPMLLQMPLLFALFIVFRTTIELRQAPFVLWIDDLSSPDALIPLPFTLPLYGDQISLLPILMGISMFLQQKMMGTQTSGQQKYMSYFMTGFFLIIFNQFPSGLNLYYTLFNVLTILQQKYMVTPAKVITESVPKKRKR